MTATMFEAKTKLSKLVKLAAAGEEVILTNGRDRKPVARIVPIEPVKVQRLGLLYDKNFEIPDSFWEPLSDEECGYGGDDLL